MHDTAYRYSSDVDPTEPGGMAAIYRDLVTDAVRTIQVVGDVTAALNGGRHCLVLTQ